MTRPEKELEALSTEMANQKYQKNIDKYNEMKAQCAENINKGKKCQAFLTGDVIGDLRVFEFKQFYMIDKTEVRSFADVIDEDVNDIKRNQKDITPYYQQKALKTALKTYLGLKYRSENKSFLDKLKHPFQSIKLFFVKMQMKSMLKNNYNLTDKALEECEKYSTYSFEEKNKVGFMDRDGNVYQTKATKEEILEAKQSILESDKLKDNIEKDIEKENPETNILKDKQTEKTIELDNSLEI